MSNCRSFGRITMASCGCGTSSCATSLSPTDSDTVAFEYNTCTKVLSADVTVSATEGNILQAVSDGLYVPPQTVDCTEVRDCISVTDSETVDLSYDSTTGVITADVKVSADAGNTIVANADGVFSQDSGWEGTNTETEAELGTELITNGDFATDLSDWTSTGWTWSAGKAQHTVGNTNALSQSITVQNGATYLISTTLSGSTTGNSLITYVISINGTACPNYNTVEHGQPGQSYSAYVATTTGTVTFAITPTNLFDGAIDNVSVKAVSSINSAISSIYDFDNTIFAEVRGRNVDSNFAIGRYSLEKALTTIATANTAIGRRAMVSTITGYENTAIGDEALEANLVGYGNTALGYRALAENNSGFLNVGAGNEALTSLTSGAYNVAVGRGAQHEATSCYSNTAVGTNALYANITGNYSVAIGGNALLNSLNGQNTSIGVDSSRSITTGVYNVAIGQYALYSATTTNHNNAFGIQTLYSATGAQNAAFGSQALSNLVAGDNNVALGYYAGINQTSGNRNIAIGASISCVNATGDDQLNIGNTIYGDLAEDQIGIGVTAPSAAIHLKASTTAAGTAPIKLTSGTNMTTPEDGAFEYDGTNLYFTVGAVRKTVTLV